MTIAAPIVQEAADLYNSRPVREIREARNGAATLGWLTATAGGSGRRAELALEALNALKADSVLSPRCERWLRGLTALTPENQRHPNRRGWALLVLAVAKLNNE